MRKGLKIVFFILLIAGGAVLCAVRWQAWFGTPEEPRWTGDRIAGRFSGPSGDSVMTFLVLGDVHNRLTHEDYDSLAARVPEAQAVIQTGDWLDRGQTYYRQLLMREWTQS